MVLGPKVFSADEIAMLKTKNGDDSQSTYEIFEEMDEMTKSCELSWASDEYSDWLVDDAGVKQGLYVESYSLWDMWNWILED